MEKIKHMGVGSIFVWFFCLSLGFLSFSPVMQILRLGSLNVNGLRDGGKRVLLSEFIRLKDTQVTFLQEIIVTLKMNPS